MASAKLKISKNEVHEVSKKNESLLLLNMNIPTLENKGYEEHFVHAHVDQEVVEFVARRRQFEEDSKLSMAKFHMDISSTVLMENEDSNGESDSQSPNQPLIPYEYYNLEIVVAQLRVDLVF